jgi:hypothetical protein
MMNKTCWNEYPFDWIIITFPDQQSAAFASTGPLEVIRRKLPVSTQVITTHDPYHTRVVSSAFVDFLFRSCSG